jgi:Protein of unknown function (DUF642)
MTRNILTVFGLISYLVLPQYVYANALTNGDFETPDQGNFFSFDILAGSTFITGWTVTQGSVDLTTTACCFPAFSGHQAVDLVGTLSTGGLTQIFATTRQPDVVNGEHVAAGLLRKLLILSIHGLLICGSSYEVDLASEGDTSGDDGSSLVVKIEKLDNSLVNLLFDPSEVILEPTNKRTCRF